MTEVEKPKLTHEQELELGEIQTNVRSRIFSPERLLGYLGVFLDNPKLILPGARASRRISNPKRGENAS